MGALNFFWIILQSALDSLQQVCDIDCTMKEQKADWPRTVTAGNASVKVYRRITGSGKPGFMVAYRDVDGKRKFESCSVETEAMKLAEKKAQTLSTFGARVAGTSGDQMAEFVRVSDLLKPFGVALGAVVDRVTGWLTKHGTLEAIDRVLVAGPVARVGLVERTVEQAVDEMVEAKKSNGVSDAYKRDLKWRLGLFAKGFKCNVSTITTVEIQKWMDAQKFKSTSYMNMRRNVGVFFSWCVARGYCAANPIGKDKVESRKETTGEIQIYSPDEMRKLLDAAPDDLKIRLAISGFAGVRTAELRRLTWAGVNFAEGYIILGTDVVKNHRTASRRVVPMSDNLRAWLLPFKDRKGKVSDMNENDSTFFDMQRECATKAGVPWKQNALRHSFCSYRLAVVKDASKVAFEAGNSAAMIHGNYKALVTEQAGKEWFAIKPN
jgi:site-specific recombinase XerD